MKEGVILRGIGGFYDIMADGDIFRCRARGRFRNMGITPMVGDWVRFIPETQTTEGSLEEILPRKNTLIRPPVANIDNLAVVIAAAQPEPDLLLADKLIVLAERKGISPIMVINKIDLVQKEEIDRLKAQYEKTGYPIYCVSVKLGEGIDALARGLKGITTLAGQSGVGKSSIINSLHPHIVLETGDVSHKIKRGRHTTRHVELLTLPYGGMIVDTPGFSQLELMDFEPSQLQESYPEFHDYIDDCYFKMCLHVSEPDCAVRCAVEEGKLAADRYERYVKLIYEIKGNRRSTR